MFVFASVCVEACVCMCMNVLICMLVCVCVCVRIMLGGASASCSIIQMLPPYPSSGPAVTTQTRSDENNASVTASILCPGALRKRATFSCRAHEGASELPQYKALYVYSPKPSTLIVCVCFKALRRFGGES